MGFSIIGNIRGNAMSAHKSKGKLKLTQDEVLFRFKEKHGDEFDYSLFVFFGYNEKSKITCRTHGVFYQSPAHHFRGQGCPDCKYIKISKKLKKDNKYFLDKSNIVHKEAYDYSLSKYDGYDSIVSIICQKHGVFNQVASVHLAGHGCKGCAIDSLSSSTTKNIDHFLSKAKAVHGDVYDYSYSVYSKTKDKIKIRCRDHGFFYQDVSNHLAGKGCPKCGLSGFSRSSYNDLCKRRHKGKSNIYLIKCFNENEEFFKIGITSSKRVNLRFPSKKSMPYNYKVVFFLQESSDFIWDIERKIHNINKKNKYKPKIYFAGETECYSIVDSGIIKMFESLQNTSQLQLIA